MGNNTPTFLNRASNSPLLRYDSCPFCHGSFLVFRNSPCGPQPLCLTGHPEAATFFPSNVLRPQTRWLLNLSLLLSNLPKHHVFTWLPYPSSVYYPISSSLSASYPFQLHSPIYLEFRLVSIPPSLLESASHCLTWTVFNSWISLFRPSGWSAFGP